MGDLESSFAVDALTMHSAGASVPDILAVGKSGSVLRMFWAACRGAVQLCHSSVAATQHFSNSLSKFRFFDTRTVDLFDRAASWSGKFFTTGVAS